MKKIILLLAPLLVLVSCENKTETLATCYRDIHYFANASSECSVKIINGWADYLIDWYEDGRQLFNDGFIDVFDKIVAETDWDGINETMQSVDSTLNKRYPSKYKSIRDDLFRLYNIARQLRTHARKVDYDYLHSHDVREYRKEYYELCDKYNEAMENFESRHPEIVGQLHSLDELY